MISGPDRNRTAMDVSARTRTTADGCGDNGGYLAVWADTANRGPVRPRGRHRSRNDSPRRGEEYGSD